jgi:hypothetical protein
MEDKGGGKWLMGLSVHECGGSGMEETVMMDQPLPDTRNDTGRKNNAELFLGDTECNTLEGEQWNA